MKKRNAVAKKEQTPELIMELLEKGEIAPGEAFARFSRLSVGKGQVGVNDSEYRRKIDEIMGELDSLIGLEAVKKLVREIQAFVEIQKRRSQERLAAEPTVLHMVFRGNPGTGKTTVARILGAIFREMGVISKGHLVEVERADLVGEYIGHTARKTREHLRRALGGILFIDEAYSLARGNEKDFGKEAIDTLVKDMEDHKHDLILILAGYRNEMEMFLQANPGLRSRFPIHIDFPDYSGSELLAIADLMVQKRQYKLSAAAKEAITSRLTNNGAGSAANFGNARVVRNLVEKAIRRQAVRLVRKKYVTRDELMLLEREDIEEE
ncbi:MAG: AAA family ATPase [bacterium]|jgi:stage V sporulation protein K